MNKTQEQVWNDIAEEWHEFKDKPSEGIIKFLEKREGKILDLGSGSGRFLMNIKKGKMYLVDFSKEMIKFANEKAKNKKINAEFFISPMYNLPFNDEFFDGAICVAALHCVEGSKNREKVVKELFRVMKKGARAKIVVWNKGSDRFKNAEKEKIVQWRDKGGRYYYLYEEKEIHDLFKKVGFKIRKSWFPARQITFVVEKV